MNISSLKNQYHEIKDTMTCRVDNHDYARFEIHKQMLATMAEIENRSLAVYDVHTMRFLMRQDKNIKLLGYNPDEFDINDIEKYHEMVHPDDIGFLYETEIMAHRFFHSLEAQERKQFKLIYDFRVRKKNGEYLRFMHQMLVLECDVALRSWLLLIISDMIEETVTRRTPRRYMMDIRTKSVIPFEDTLEQKKQLFTRRELEIIGLLAQGLESDQIAGKLYISINTVNNHRQNLLSKAGVSNTMQVLLFVNRIGLV